MSLGNQGQGGGSGTNGGNGYMKITYSGQEEGTTVPGTITSPAGEFMNVTQRVILLVVHSSKYMAIINR